MNSFEFNSAQYRSWYASRGDFARFKIWLAVLISFADGTRESVARYSCFAFSAGFPVEVSTEFNVLPCAGFKAFGKSVKQRVEEQGGATSGVNGQTP